MAKDEDPKYVTIAISDIHPTRYVIFHGEKRKKGSQVSHHMLLQPWIVAGCEKVKGDQAAQIQDMAKKYARGRTAVREEPYPRSLW